MMAMSGNRIMVAAIDPPKMMIIACSLMNMCRSPPMSTIAVTTIMPDTSPTLVMISMGNSNAHANFRPSWTEARPTSDRVTTLRRRN